MVYVVAGGEYSDWYIEGYFTDRKEAEKYVAFHNKKNGYDEYRIMDLEEIGADNNLPTPFEYHSVVFDLYTDENDKIVKFILRNEPFRFISTYDKKPKQIHIGWNCIEFDLIACSRSKAEKIAEDLMYQILWEDNRASTFEDTVKRVCEGWELIK